MEQFQVLGHRGSENSHLAPGGSDHVHVEARAAGNILQRRSTPASIAAGAPSWLAICETLLATAISAYVVASHHVIPAFVAATVAPLLLLRTDTSTRLGIAWLEKAHDRLLHERKFEYHQPRRFPHTLWILVTLVRLSIRYGTVAIISVPIKIAVTTWSAIRHPIVALQAIPRNWLTVALCMDTLHPPELVPGYESSHVECEDLKFTTLRRITIGDPGMQMWFRIAAFLAILPMHVPALVYRWSLKSTALVYAPVVWVAYRATAIKRELWLAQLVESSMSKIARWVVAFFMLPVVLSWLAGTWMAMLVEPIFKNAFGIGITVEVADRVLGVLRISPVWPWWRVGAVVAFVAVYTVHFMAEAIKRRCEYEAVHPARYSWLSIFVFLRGVSGYYLIICSWCLLGVRAITN
jgi:hypothetical protein